jgi:hypothetical protein
MRAFWSVGAFALPLAALWLAAGPKLAAELSALPGWAVAGAIAAHVATLACRAEAWRLAVNSISGCGMPRTLVHGASAAGFAAGALQAASAAPVRAFALRRLAPERTPAFGQTVVAEGPVVTCEAALAALVLALGVLTIPVMPFWAPALALAGCGLAILAMRQLLTLPGRNGLARGLSVLGDRRRRLAFGVLVAAVTGLGMLRAGLLLAGFALPHDPASVAIIFATLGVFGVLPLGPAATTGAMLTVFGTTDAAAAAAAGIALAATSMLAVTIYGSAAFGRLFLSSERLVLRREMSAPA